MSSRKVSEDEVRRLIGEHGIVALLPSFPAGWGFELGDGRVLRLWEGSYEHSPEWGVAGDE